MHSQMGNVTLSPSGILLPQPLAVRSFVSPSSCDGVSEDYRGVIADSNGVMHDGSL